MSDLVIEKKKYVVITRREYDFLKRKAALKTKPNKVLTISEARAFSKSLIRKWAKGK
jgi:hypothetical protein